MRKYHWPKKVIACILAAGFSTCGISAVPAAVRADEETGAAMGRFLESEITFPGMEEDADHVLILDMKRTADGKLRIITNVSDREGAHTLWESGDQGESWEQVGTLSEELDELYFAHLTLDADGGGGSVGMLFGEDDDFELHFVSFDAEGNADDLLFPEESVNVVCFTRDGKCAGRSWGGAAYSLDRKTAAIENTFATDDVEQIAACGEEVLLLTPSEVLRYDIESGEPLEADEALNTALYADGKDYTDISTLGAPILFDETEDGRLIYCSHSGIFLHEMGGSVVEQVVDGTLNSLSDPSLNLVALTELDGSFFLTCIGSEGGSKILKYTYDPNVSSQPEKEVSIYSLREDSGIRQVITMFQNQHPDTYINYETGMNGADGVTVSDALRTLNTDILAGNGPDILVMDRMSVDTYAGKGMLTDLSGILEEVKAEDGILENIACTWQNAEGIPAVPVGFGIFMAAGKTELLEQLNGPKDLVQLAGEEGVLDYVSVAELPDYLYYLCAPGWEKEDHTIDQEKLEDYVRTVREVYENMVQTMTGSDKELMERWWDEESAWLDEWICHGDMGFAGMEILTERMKLYPGVLLDMMTFSTVISAEEKVGGFDNRLFGIDGTGTFYPICTVGILNTAREPEEARSFVRFLLSKEGELANGYDGFPVNKAALEEKIYTNPYEGSDVVSTYSTENTETGEREELEVVWPKKEQLDWLMQSAERLEARAENEEVQERVVVGETRRCMRGEISVEEAVNSILQKLNLYLAENGE